MRISDVLRFRIRYNEKKERKKAHPSTDVRQGSCPNIPNMVSPKPFAPKETIPYPDRKTSHILIIVATK